MKILVNAFSVAYSGGLILTLNIINTFKLYSNINFLVIAPDVDYYNKVISKNVRIIRIPGLYLKKIFRIYTDIFLIKKIIKDYNPDLILSLGNLPALTKRYQVFLHDNPLASVIKFDKIGYNGLIDIIINKLRNKILDKRLNNVNHLITQTKVQLNKLQEVYPDQIQKIKRKSIITPSTPDFQINSKGEIHNIQLLDSSRINLLCLSRYYPHKNIEILLDLAVIFKKSKSPFNIILTISPEHGKRAGHLIRRIRKYKLSDYITNIGEISPFSLTKIMDCVDAIILPSLIESYSLIFIEAMFFHKPIFTSDLDFAREVCKNAAFYFNPFNAENIFNVISSAFNKHDEMQKRIKYGTDIIKSLDSWDAIINTILKHRSTI